MVFFIVTAAELMLTIQFILIGPLPKEVVVALGTFTVLCCRVPVVKVAVLPLTVRVNPARSSVPLVSLKFVIPALAFNRQVLALATMVTLSMVVGTPLGVQLAGVFQSVDREPFQV